MFVLRRFFSLFALASLLTLSACGSSQEAYRQADLLPLPPVPVDLEDQYARQAVREFLIDTGAPVASTYDLQRHDLNGDGRREALVLFKTPYGYWCKQHGCTMLVMQAHDDHFSLRGNIRPIREPLYISEQTSHGWKTIITRLSGRWSRTKDVALTYDGHSYPGTPEHLPAYLRYAYYAETPIFYE